MILSLIFAIDESNAIGYDNKLPWHLPADMRIFKTLTMGHYVIMGRHTAQGMGKALPGRVNIVVSSRADFSIPDMLKVDNLSTALAIARDAGEEEAFVIGGAMLFKEALPLADKYYQTIVHHVFGADTYLPAIDMKNWKIIHQEEHLPDEKNHYSFTFRILEKC